ncbi:hypothetical protein EDD96_4618 [Streptomyces sp. Ag109_G2-6]|uniref:hypothetical protein n=1 Tax=Streptomyces TaxID=1883 RepID=UPI0009A4BEC6|nr:MULTISPECIES: hypothetical protein [Streptomyces]RPF40839.1 hypothetical protein EDD96_4618 [Streptomyces sp. Ag109_G2-6]
MNLKRMAVVAAAAVVGPTVLMATPAMADEAKNTAVTTPDSAPKGDSAAAETPAAPAADTAKPAVETPAPAKDAKPAAEKPAPAPAPEAKPAPAPEHKAAQGPKVALSGLPSTFKAGGSLQKFEFEVDNTSGKHINRYHYAFKIEGNVTADQIDGRVLAYDEESGEEFWDEGYVYEDGGDVYIVYVGNSPLEPGDHFTMDVQLRFTKSTKAGDIKVQAIASNDDGSIQSESATYKSKITSDAGSNTGGNTGDHHTGGGNTGGGNDTKPNGGGTTTPIVDHNTGTGTGTGTGTNTGGELAETGADAATSWALGTGGVALAMGAALVAGTGRRRRVTN